MNHKPNSAYLMAIRLAVKASRLLWVWCRILVVLLTPASLPGLDLFVNSRTTGMVHGLLVRLVTTGLRERQRLESKKANSAVHRVPGHRLMTICCFLYSPKTSARVFQPIIADLQSEYIDALGKGEKWKSRWIRTRGYWAFFNALGLQAVVSLVKKIAAIWKVT